MKNRIVVAVSGILVLLSVLSGLLWWAIGFRRGAFRQISAGGYGVILVVFAVFQLAAWAVAVMLFWKFRHAERELPSWPLIALAGVLVFATLLWGVTPILGIPLMLVVIVGGSVAAIRLRKMAP